ncbi:hypothetical protein CQW44_14470 [Streptomyces griseofuscus]|uniref:DUF1214 domain-containing protein n=1 Tax=Streptomyces griseofuscus TaxID=146922 RepID=A0A426S7J6_9ACTN|nr:hypothetical protein CQW44_14470 [Streptomyces griseofuscus]
MLNFDDAEGDKLSSAGRYELRFPGDALPPVYAFWPLTACGEDMNLIPDPADRYSVGDRSAGLGRDADGGHRWLISRSLLSPPPTCGQGRPKEHPRSAVRVRIGRLSRCPVWWQGVPAECRIRRAGGGRRRRVRRRGLPPG